MALHFRRLGSAFGPSDYFWANADGSDEDQLGQPGYEVRKVQGTWRAIGPNTDDAGSIILCDGLPTRQEAMAVCEEDLPKYQRQLQGE